MLGLGTFTLSTLSGFLSPLSCCYLSQCLNVTSSRLLGHPSFTRSLILVHGITLSPSLVVSPPYPQFCILRFNQQQIQNIQGKNPRKFQNTQQLNLSCTSSCLHSIYKEIKPVNSKGNQPWIFIGRTDDEAEAPMLWPPDSKSWLIGKDPDLGKDWEQEEKGVTEDDGGMALLSLSKLREWRTWSLMCCNSWGCKESNTT